MGNEEKARELAIRLMGGGNRNIQPLVDALIDMAEWKDEHPVEISGRLALQLREQAYKKGYDKAIEKACEWLKNNMYEGTCEQILSKKPYPFMQDYINEVKKAMEE